MLLWLWLARCFLNWLNALETGAGVMVERFFAAFYWLRSHWACELRGDSRRCTSFQVQIKPPPPKCDSDALATVSKNIQWITANNKTNTQHFQRDAPIWCEGGGGDWSPIMLCLDETMKNGPSRWHVNIRAGDAPAVLGSYLIRFFFKMIALVTFSLPVCQFDIAIFPLSSLSCSVSFILKRHFTHGWL